MENGILCELIRIPSMNFNENIQHSLMLKKIENISLLGMPPDLAL